MQRRVRSYQNYVDVDRLRRRIKDLNAAGKMDKEIATILNREGFVAARGCAFKNENVWLLRTRWGIPTVKINGAGANPMRWPDGSFSVQGAAAALGSALVVRCATNEQQDLGGASGQVAEISRS